MSETLRGAPLGQRVSAAHLVPARREGHEERLGVDIHRIKTEFAGIAEVHGVELVALEWLQGPGRGVLRAYIDRPGGDPRVVDPARGISADVCASVSRDIGAVLDADETLIPMAFDLEVSSPGFERPVQKREDFDRFAGLVIAVKLRERVESRGAFEGVLRGTADAPGGGYVVKVDCAGRVWDLPAKQISRAKLAEIKAPAPTKPSRPAKGQGKTKQRPEDARSATEGGDGGSSPAR